MARMFLACCLLIFTCCWFGKLGAAATVWRSEQLRVPASSARNNRLPRIFVADISALNLPLVLPVSGDRERQHKIAKLFAPWRSARARLATTMQALGDLSADEILALFKPARKYTYVITAQHLFFAPLGKHLAHKLLDKHYFVGNYAEIIYFAGECWLDADRHLVIDNNSGTYCPPASRLSEIVQVFAAGLGIVATPKVFM